MFWVTENKLPLEPRTGDVLEWTVDRIDITRGYSIDNIQPMRMIENVYKFYHRERFRDNLELPLEVECPF